MPTTLQLTSNMEVGMLMMRACLLSQCFKENKGRKKRKKSQEVSGVVLPDGD